MKVLSAHRGPRGGRSKERGAIEFRLRTKRKFGPDLDVEYVRRSARVVMLCGPHNSGKSRYLVKLAGAAGEFWHAQQRPYSPRTSSRPNPERPTGDAPARVSNWTPPPALVLHVTKPLSSWTDAPEFRAWFETAHPEAETWSRVPSYVKQEALAGYLEASRAVLCIDDADKLNGRKLELVKLYARSAFRTVLTCKDENKLPMSLRLAVTNVEHQILRLDSDAAYDATSIALWLAVLVCIAAGATELAMILFGLKMWGVAGGAVTARAARQN